MTPTQRSRHRLIWTFLPVVLFALYFYVIRLGPVELPADGLDFGQPPALPQVLADAETSNFMFILRGAEGVPGRQLEVVVGMPLDVPSAVLEITIDAAPDQPKVLGVLQSQGIYRYPLDSLQGSAKSLYINVLDVISGEVFEGTVLSAG